MGANSLLDTIVFGQRSGAHAARASRELEYIEFDVDETVRREQQRIQDILDRPQNGDRVGDVRLGMGQSMNKKSGRLPRRKRNAGDDARPARA